MNDAQRFRLEMLQRVDGFLAPLTVDFVTGSKGLLLIGKINDELTEANDFRTQQQTGGSGQHSGTSSKAQAYLDLHEDIDAIARTAHSMADEIPGIEAKFRRPRNHGDETLKTTARAFLRDATPLEAEFIAYEIRADFLADLTHDLAVFEAAEGTQGSSLDSQVAGTKGLDDALLAGVLAVHKLDAIIRNKYHTQPTVLAAWTSASHVERATRHHTPTTPSP